MNTDLGKATAHIDLDISGFSKNIDKAEHELNQFVDSSENINTRMEASFDKIGRAATLGLGAAVTAVGALSVKALTLGGELEQSLGGVEAVYGDYYDNLVGISETAYNQMGLSQQAFLSRATQMGALLTGAGYETQAAMELTTSAMQRAADVSAIMGINVEDAMYSIQGAMKGNFTMMDNLGVAMNATTIGAYALSKGITTAYADMDNMTKTGLAMEMFMEKTAYATGQYARENETLAGALQTAKAAYEDFMTGSMSAEEFSDAFVNALDIIVDNLQEIVPRLADGLQDVFHEVAPQAAELGVDLASEIITGFARENPLLTAGIALFGTMAIAVKANTVATELNTLAVGLNNNTMVMGGNAAKVLTTQISAKTIATNAATFATKAWGVAMAALPYAAVLVGVTALAAGIANHLNKAVEEQDRKMIEASRSINEYNERLAEVTAKHRDTTALQNMADRYEELRTKTGRTNEEFEELASLARQLNGILPEGSSLINAQTGEYEAMADSVQAVIDRIEQFQNKQIFEFNIEDGKKQIEELQSAIDELQADINERMELANPVPPELAIQLRDLNNELSMLQGGVIDTGNAVYATGGKMAMWEHQLENVNSQIKENNENLKSLFPEINAIAGAWGHVEIAVDEYGKASVIATDIVGTEIIKHTNNIIAETKRMTENSKNAIAELQGTIDGLDFRRATEKTYTDEQYWEDYRKAIETHADQTSDEWQKMNTTLLTHDKQMYLQLQKEQEEANKKALSDQKTANDKRIKAQQDNDKKVLDETNKFLERKRQNNNLSADEEIRTWKAVFDSYAEGHENRIKAEEELTRISIRLAKEREDLDKKRIDVEKQMTEAIKTRANTLINSANAESTSVQATARRKLGLEAVASTEKQITQSAKDYQESIKSQKEAIEQLNKKLEELKNAKLSSVRDVGYAARDQEYKDNLKDQEKVLKQIAEAEENLKETHANALKAREESLKSQARLEIEAMQATLDNLNAQIKAHAELQKQLRETDLTSEEQRSLAGNLSNEQVTALKEATQAERDEYIKLWRETQKLANEAAEYEVRNSDVGKELKNELLEVEDKINELNIGSNIGNELMDGIVNAINSKDEAISNALINALGKVDIREILATSLSSSANATRNIIDGSHAAGLDYVPYDNYLALLHKGERVMTADENTNSSQLQSGNTYVQNIYGNTADRYEVMRDTEDLLRMGN